MCDDREGPRRRLSPLKSPVSATTVVWCLSWSSTDSIFCRFTGDTDIIHGVRGGARASYKEPCLPGGEPACARTRPSLAPAARRPRGGGSPPARSQSHPRKEEANQSKERGGGVVCA